MNVSRWQAAEQKSKERNQNVEKGVKYDKSADSLSLVSLILISRHKYWFASSAHRYPCGKLLLDENLFRLATKRESLKTNFCYMFAILIFILFNVSCAAYFYAQTQAPQIARASCYSWPRRTIDAMDGNAEISPMCSKLDLNFSWILKFMELKNCLSLKER